MGELNLIIMISVFTITIFVMLSRPFGLNETVPTSIGALIVLLAGIVPLADVARIFSIVSGASLTIISTIIMSIVLDSIGFFRWIAVNIVQRSNGSGIKLYIYINLLCFFMTLFFNNDGSILITTPIIIHIVHLLKLKPHQMTPYFISGALIATAASAPIAVSNISNLIALKIVGLSLNSYIQMMFVPAMLAIIVIAVLLYRLFHRSIPKKIRKVPIKWNEGSSRYEYTHPLSAHEQPKIDWLLFKVSMVIVIATRTSFFVLSPFGVSIEWIGLTGALLMIAARWIRMKKGAFDIITKTPWHILLFAFNMYVLVYGLKNVGLNTFLTAHLQNYVHGSGLQASLIMGLLLTVFSNIFNNLPAVMIGTLAITDLGLAPHMTQITYLANVMGSDIGALLTPVGTLATLIWMYLLKEHGIPMTWGKYIRVTILVIPVGLIVGLCSLYYWIEWFVY
ncbi:arsenic transporter [Falsibacillus pallidus]|uniref:Arsenite efflux membrane protein ArsB n=1 Tax=Falsibacillus pallidus TaxID=493781 RepID=A0A370GCZ8_9BACI|nr:arsenic transporter [Falsibacillus pallidus]RDI41591.1 arsenite efflux membrane protein ArsB [Falsibacillus pallidus]